MTGEGPVVRFRPVFDHNAVADLNRDQVISLMERDFLDSKDCHKHVTVIGKKPDITVVMGCDPMIPINRPDAGKQVTRPFTNVWAERSEGWKLVACQATITIAN
jgi:hypothetical protein